MQVIRLEMTEFMGMFTVEQGSYLYVLSVYLEKNGVKNFDQAIKVCFRFVEKEIEDKTAI